MDEPIVEVIKLELHQPSSGVYPLMRVVEVVARRDSNSAARPAVIERSGVDRVAGESMELYAIRAGDAGP